MAETYSDQPTLEKWNQLAASVAGKGNCRIVWGTYTGRWPVNEVGICPITLTFDGMPIVLIVREDSPGGLESLLAVRGMTDLSVGTHQAEIDLIWGNDRVTWQGGTSQSRFDLAGYTYCYAALVAMDE